MAWLFDILFSFIILRLAFLNRIDCHAGKSGMHLQIPKSEYRLQLVNAPNDDEDAKAPSSKPRQPATWKFVWIVLCLCLALRIA